jgi:hypothetical protein
VGNSLRELESLSAEFGRILARHNLLNKRVEAVILARCRAFVEKEGGQVAHAAQVRFGQTGRSGGQCGRRRSFISRSRDLSASS